MQKHQKSIINVVQITSHTIEKIESSIIDSQIN